MKKRFGIILSTFILTVMSLNTFGAEGVIKDGRTLVPVRGVFESLGFTVNWDSSTNKASISDGTHEVSVIKGLSYFKADGKEIYPDVPQQIINGSLYLPLRAIGDAVGANTSWDSENKMAHINYNGKNVYIKCATENTTQQQTSNSETKQTMQSNETGIIINHTSYSGKNSTIMLPLTILKNFGFQNYDSFGTSFRDSNYTIECLGIKGMCKITDNQNKVFKHIMGVYYNGAYCAELGDLCRYINANYSWDENKQVAHISYGNKDMYIKFYEKFDLSQPYGYNVPSLINVDAYAFPIAILGSSKTGFKYYYKDFYEYLDVYFDYISVLQRSGFSVINSGDDTRNLKYVLKKGNIEVKIEGEKISDGNTIYISIDKK